MFKLEAPNVDSCWWSSLTKTFGNNWKSPRNMEYSVGNWQPSLMSTEQDVRRLQLQPNGFQKHCEHVSVCFLQAVSLMCFRTFFCENMDDIALRLNGIYRNRNNAKPMTVSSREEYLRGQNRKGTWTQQISQHRLQIYPIDSTRWVHPRTSWETRSPPILRGWH